MDTQEENLFIHSPSNSECITIRSQYRGRCREVMTPTIQYDSICDAQKGSREGTGHNDAAGAPKSSFPGAAAMRKPVLVLIGLRSSFADCRATSRQRAAIICAWMSICVI